MNKTLIATAAATVVVLAALGLRAGEHEEDEYEEHEGRGGQAPTVLRDPGYAQYQTECGDCHMAYPPALLPAASWEGVMAGLADHFGDNAELDSATSREISAFLVRNAADRARGEYAERTRRATRDRTPPLRITQTDYFRGQHHEIPASMVTANSDVGSFSRCEACHGRADQGIFEEHEVRIPGHGRWDD
jgi:hypothetical protein